VVNREGDSNYKLIGFHGKARGVGMKKEERRKKKQKKDGRIVHVSIAARTAGGHFI
jgi:hypothetical protein